MKLRGIMSGGGGATGNVRNPMKGPDGLSTYEIWLKDGNTGSEQDFLNSLQGRDGESAYQLWLAAGNKGSEKDFLDSLQGKDYVLTSEDKKQIAQQAAELVEVPELPEDTATEGWVKEYAQPKGSYVTEGQLQQAVEDAVKDLDFDVDLDGYATTEQLKQVEDKMPDQLADLQEDSSHRTVTDTEKQSWNNKSDFSGKYNDLQNKPASLPASDVADWAKQPDKPSYTKNDVGLDKVANERQYSANNPPPYPVTSVNGQTGAVDVEPKGTGAQKVAEHNTSDVAHSDIRLILENLITKVNTLLDSDDTTLDQTKEIVAYIKANRELLESVTTNKVNVADIIDNLTTSVSNKPLSAKQGVQLKALIDAIKVPTKLSELSGDSTHRTVTDSEKNSWNNKSDFSGKYVDLQGRPTNVSAFNNDAGYMKSTEQQTVIDNALAQAKASGEFDGKDGKNPVKGTDYFTPEEIQSIVAEVQAEATQLEPLYAESLEWLEANGDTSKVYVLSDGFIYANIETTGVGGDAYTNLLPTATMGNDQATGWVEGAGYTQKARLSGSSGSVSTGYTSANGLMCASGYIPAKAGDVIRIKGYYPPDGAAAYVIAYNGATKVGSKTFQPANNIASGTGAWWWTAGDWYTFDKNPVMEATVTFTLDSGFGTGFNAIRFSGYMTEDTIVTVNQEIVEGGTSVIVKKWTSTGHAFVPANYDGEIAKLKTVTDTHTAEIKEINDKIANVESGVSSLTDDEKLERIKNWDVPIYDANIPVFALSAEKPAMTNATMTPTALYAMYDALMVKYPHYITKTDLGLCSDGVNHVYRYDFKEPEQRRENNRYSETKIKAILMSGVHYEWAGIYSLYYALEEIAENPALRDLKRNTHFIVIPCSNPFVTLAENLEVSGGQHNANGVEVHQNFEVGFYYPDHPDYVPAGELHHGGTEPLSEVETQYIDNILKNNTDAALFLTCHNMNFDSAFGMSFIWGSVATNYMCNMSYRLIDKMSQMWMDKYADELAAGIADYRTDALEEWDTRLGHSQISINNGTETRQATKYGIQAANIEVCERFWVHGTKANQEPLMSSFSMSRGAETYVNFLLTALGVYDYKDKEQYYKNMPWEE